MLQLTLCDRCKRLVKGAGFTLVTVQVRNEIVGYICEDCVEPVRNLILTDLAKVEIPEPLRQYLSSRLTSDEPTKGET